MDSTALIAWRATLLVILTIEAIAQAGLAFWLRQYRPASASGWYVFVSESSVATMLLIVVTVVALWRFLGSRASLLSGAVALLGIKLAAESFATVFTVHNMDFYQGGAMLLGVFLGETYAYFIGVRPQNSRAEWWEARRFGMTGALGMLAGSYIAAGTSKVLTGGLAWAGSSALRLMLISHTEVEGSPWALAIPMWTANNPLVCMALEGGTLIIQLGSFCLLLGPRVRRLWAALIVAFHAGIYLTSHILFVSPIIFAAAVAVPWRRILPIAVQPLADEVEEARQRPPSKRALLLIGVVVLAVYAVLTETWHR